MESEKKLLFSEDQVNALVEARQNAWVAQQQLEDSPPKTVTLNRVKMIEKLKQMEEEVRKKHGEAVTLWRKAFKKYAQYIAQNPGAKGFNDPGPKPEIPQALEDFRAWIKAIECVDGSSESIKLPVDQWIGIFQNAGRAISTMRAKRDQYALNVSGTTLLNMTTSDNTVSLR